ncbi:MAG: hypothetical protein WCX22_12975, partial [Methanoregula sp.]
MTGYGRMGYYRKNGALAAMVKRYLRLRSLDEALTLLTSTFAAPHRTERVPVIQAAGRVAAEPVYAKYSVPEVNISAMDGIAVRSRDTI